MRKESAPSAHRSVAILAAAGALAFSAYTVKGCGSNTSNPTVSAESTVDRIVPSTEDPLLDVFGSTSAEAEEYTEIFGKKIPQTGRSSSGTSNGVIELRAKDNALKYGVYKLPSINQTGVTKYGILATLNMDQTYIRPSLSTLFVNGKPVVESKQQILGMSDGYGVLKRREIAATAAKVHFIYSCGREAFSAIMGSVKIRAKDDVKDQSVIAAKLPGGKNELELRQQMAREDVKVIFTKTDPRTKRTVAVEDLSSITMKYQETSQRGSPIKPLVNEKAALDQILSSSKDAANVEITLGGPCKFSGDSAKKLAELSGVSNTGV